MNRRLLALLALAGLLTLSGCLGAVTGGPASDDRLDQPPEAEYEWDARSDVHITITTEPTYRAVYDVSADGFEERIELSEAGFLGTDTPVSIRSLRYRYPNGTVINGSAFDEHGGSVGTANNALVIEPPGEEGKLAYAGDSTPKQFVHPAPVDGSYRVVLPEGREASVPLFGRIVPSPDSTVVVDGHLNVVWLDLSNEALSVRYYLPRDVQLFGGLLVGVLGVGVVGGAYYRREIKRLQQRREEMGLNVDIERDDDDGPPPGMR